MDVSLILDEAYDYLDYAETAKSKGDLLDEYSCRSSAATLFFLVLLNQELSDEDREEVEARCSECSKRKLEIELEISTGLNNDHSVSKKTMQKKKEKKHKSKKAKVAESDSSEDEDSKPILKEPKIPKNLPKLCGAKSAFKHCQVVFGGEQIQKAYCDNFQEHLPRSVLLFGPPGNGKTLLVKTLAKESGYNFFDVKVTDVKDKYHGNVDILFSIINL